jgi:preprotein translocase subunit Sec61beta
MPQIAELQEEFGGDDFEVLTIATGRNTPAGIVKFFEENGITNLPRHTDPKQALARTMAVIGLPITVLINREGQEVARLLGDAEWNSDSAKAIVKALIDSEATN